MSKYSINKYLYHHDIDYHNDYNNEIYLQFSYYNLHIYPNNQN